MSDFPDISSNNENVFEPEEEEEEVKEIPKEEPKVSDKEPYMPKTIEEKLAMNELTNRINKWKITFPKHTKSFKTKPNMCYDDLVDLEKEIEYHIASCNGGDMIKSGVFSVSTLAEKVGPRYNFHLQGLSQALASNPHFVNILKEAECKYGSTTYSDPVIRLGMTMTYTATLIHYNNLSNMQKKLHKKTEEDLNEKYKDV